MTVDLAELRALWEAGTRGEWTFDTDGIAFGFYGADDERIMSASGHWSTTAPSDADAALIVAMHAALPQLLDEIERLREELDFQRKALVQANVSLDMLAPP